MLLAEPPFVSFQGEGRFQGRNSLFIRFAGCNLRCRDCDTKYSWAGGTCRTEYGMDIIRALVTDTDSLVFTGGEPLLSSARNAVASLISEFPDKHFEIETNGTIEPDTAFYTAIAERDVLFNISPKENFPQEMDVESPREGSCDTAHTVETLILRSLPPGTDFIVKFLLNGSDDFAFMEAFAGRFGIPPGKVYVQPVGKTATEIREKALAHFDGIMKRKYSLSLRGHIFLFGNSKGK